MRQKRAVAVGLLLLGMSVAGWFWWPEASSEAGSAVRAPEVRTPPDPVVRQAVRSVADGGPTSGSIASSPGVVSWGSGDGQLGHSRPDEANPEAPMSLAPAPGGGVWVLDQVNGRLVKFGASGAAETTVRLTQQAPQDVTVAADGTVVVMDRLVDKSVALFGPDGKQRGELPLVGRGLTEGGASTGILTDGTSVLVEREHGDLVRLGSTDGVRDQDRPEVPGRPSRDGALWLTASIADGAAGQVLLTAIERPSRTHRFTRALHLPGPTIQLVLLDSDRVGLIYLGAVVELPGSTPAAAQFGIHVVCLDAAGRPLGALDLPANSSPDETFRELVVSDEGGVTWMQRTDQGVQFVHGQCH